MFRVHRVPGSDEQTRVFATYLRATRFHRRHDHVTHLAQAKVSAAEI